MAEQNILAGDVNVLDQMINDLNVHKETIERQGRLAESIGDIAKNTKEAQQAVQDEIDSRVKDSSDAVCAGFDKAIAGDREKLKEVQNKRDKAKLAGVKERIAAETAHIHKENEALKNQLNNTSYVSYKNLGLYVDSNNVPITSDKSQAIIDGKEYYTKNVIEGIVGNDKSITTDDNYMYIGKKVADRTSLFSDKIWVVNKSECDVNVSKKDSRGNMRSNAVQLTHNKAYIMYNTDRKYNYVSFIISIADGSNNTNNVTVCLKDENENVLYSQEISKLDEPIKVTDVAINSCSTLKIEATTASGACYCLISDAYVYN